MGWAPATRVESQVRLRAGGYVSLNSLGETPELAHHDVPAT